MLFAGQVLAVLGPAGVLSEFLATAGRRGGVGTTTYAMILEMLLGYVPLWAGTPLAVLACWGPISTILRLARYRHDPLAWATLGLWAGSLTIALVLRDWYESAVVRTWLPHGLMLVSSRDYLARFPLLDGAVVPLLEDRHREAAFLGSWGFHVLAAAATGGTSFASDNPPTAGQIEAARAMTPAGTPLLYLRVERPRGSRRAGMPSATWSGAATPCRSETVTS